MERNTPYNRLTNNPVDWDHFAHIMEAKQGHNGRTKVASTVRTVIAHKIKDKWMFLTK